MRTVDEKLILDLISNFVSTWISKCNKHNLLTLDTYHFSKINTVFENHSKSLVQHCEQSELSLHLKWTKDH